MPPTVTMYQLRFITVPIMLQLGFCQLFNITKRTTKYVNYGQCLVPTKYFGGNLGFCKTYNTKSFLWFQFLRLLMIQADKRADESTDGKELPRLMDIRKSNGVTGLPVI